MIAFSGPAGVLSAAQDEGSHSDDSGHSFLTAFGNFCMLGNKTLTDSPKANDFGCRTQENFLDFFIDFLGQAG